MILIVTLFAFLFLLLIVAAYTDLAHGKVYDWCTLPAIVSGVALNFGIGGVAGDPAAPISETYNLMNSVLGCLLGLMSLGIFCAAGGIGFGDVKLAAAIGAFIGYEYLVWSLFYAALVGGIMAFSLAIWKGRLARTLAGSLRFLFTLRPPRPVEGETPLTIPFGLALVLGTYWCWFMFLDEPRFFPALTNLS